MDEHGIVRFGPLPHIPELPLTFGLRLVGDKDETTAPDLLLQMQCLDTETGTPFEATRVNARRMLINTTSHEADFMNSLGQLFNEASTVFGIQRVIAQAAVGMHDPVPHELIERYCPWFYTDDF